MKPYSAIYRRDRPYQSSERCRYLLVAGIEPFVASRDFVSGQPLLHTYDGEQLKCARACVTARENDRAILDFHWLVLREGQAVEHFVERHDLWLCPPAQMAEVFEQAGFSVVQEPHGLIPDRGLLVAQRRP